MWAEVKGNREGQGQSLVLLGVPPSNPSSAAARLMRFRHTAGRILAVSAPSFWWPLFSPCLAFCQGCL